MDTNDIENKRVPVPGAPFLTAFIIYRPKTKTSDTSVFYNEEAWHILSLSELPKKKNGKPSLPDISPICSKWKELFDKKLDEQKAAYKEGPSGGYLIDIFQSHRRQYTVRGMILANDPSHLQIHEIQYLFILERMSHDNKNLSRIFRQWGLNPREREIVQLLLVDRSNKEIAKDLGLSLNTVKGYMKLLTRKLGTSTRTGIIAILLTEKPRPESP